MMKTDIIYSCGACDCISREYKVCPRCGHYQMIATNKSLSSLATKMPTAISLYMLAFFTFDILWKYDWYLSIWAPIVLLIVAALFTVDMIDHIKLAYTDVINDLWYYINVYTSVVTLIWCFLSVVWIMKAPCATFLTIIMWIVCLPTLYFIKRVTKKR